MRRSIPQNASHRLSLISPSRSATSQPPPPARALLHLRPTPPARPKTLRTTTNYQTNTIPRRTFFNLPDLSSILPTNNQNNNNNNQNNNNNRTRTLTATRTLPYPPAPLFDVVASVESYSQFLPFLTASTVTARDPKTSYPTRAFLTIGYGPLSETFTSRVDCDPAAWTVEARSGAKFGVDSKQDQEAAEFPGSREGIFDYLSTRWELVPEEQGPAAAAAAAPWTRVQLRIQFEFRSQFHAAVMSAVEGQMAGVMVEAFEKRMREAQR